MAATLTTYEQTPLFDPYNPNQKQIERYVGIPGGYGSFYFNRVPTKSALQGLRDATSEGFSGLPTYVQVGIVGTLAAIAGFYGMKKVGPRLGLMGRRR